MPRVTSVCIGQAKLVYRKWLTMFHGRTRHLADGTKKRPIIGHWTYWAVMNALGRERRMMISKKFYEDLVKRGVKRGEDVVDRKFKPLPPEGDV